LRRTRDDRFADEIIAEINSLNQRGGRMLSLVDLLLAGTVSAELAGELALGAQLGANIITAAGPGGAGKTTLMGALLALIPAGSRIRPVTSAGSVRPASKDSPLTYHVVHEISPAHYYGYLWGNAVVDYLRLARGNNRIASNLHADTLEEAHAQLSAPPIGAGRAELLLVDYWLFMSVSGPFLRPRRRVVSAWGSAGGEFKELWRWQGDRHVKVSTNETLLKLADGKGTSKRETDRKLGAVTKTLSDLAARKVVELKGVRAEVLRAVFERS